ncbi:MAG: carboxymuconolactone decarboxylase family protein [Halobacteriales archaeon]
MNEGFRKKHWTPAECVAGLAGLVGDTPDLMRALRADRVDAMMREKILLAVTGVNDCRYCARVHTSLADHAGVDEDTIDRILEQNVEASVSDYERPALLFARAYAAADGNPPMEEVEALRDAYDRETARDVQVFIRAIYVANLSGNTLDLWLHRLGVDVPR